MVKRNKIPKNGYITLEASGGENANDMKKLVNYYRSLSFKPWTEDKRELQLGYDNMAVPMVGSVIDLQSTCAKKARKIL